MQAIMESEDETDKRIYKFPTSQVKLDGKKSSYFEVINSLQFEACNDALHGTSCHIWICMKWKN